MLFNWSHRIAVALGVQDRLLQGLEKKSGLSETTSQTRVRNIENKKEMNKEKTSFTGIGWDPMRLLHSPIWLKLHNNIILILWWWKLSSRETKLWLVKDVLCLTWGFHSSVYIWRHWLLTFLLCSSCPCFIFFYQLLLNLDTILDQINAKAWLPLLLFLLLLLFFILPFFLLLLFLQNIGGLMFLGFFFF